MKYCQVLSSSSLDYFKQPPVGVQSLRLQDQHRVMACETSDSTSQAADKVIYGSALLHLFCMRHDQKEQAPSLNPALYASMVCPDVKGQVWGFWVGPDVVSLADMNQMSPIFPCCYIGLCKSTIGSFLSQPAATKPMWS